MSPPLAFQPGFTSRMNYPPTGTNWDPANKGTTIVLSNSNKTATGTLSVLSASSYTSGKKYYEVHFDSKVSTDPYIGVCNNDSGVLNSYQIGGGTIGASYIPNGYSYNSGSSAHFNFGTSWATGAVVGCALDISTGKVWWSVNGTWIQSQSNVTGDPASGTAPRETITIGGAAMYAGITVGTGTVLTARFSPADWTYTAPTGFSAW